MQTGRHWAMAGLGALALAGTAPALQGVVVTQTTVAPGWQARASHVVVPQARAFAWDGRREAIRLEAVRAEVRIVEQTARTTLDLRLENPSGRDAEAVLVLPVPRHAAVSEFLFEGAASEPTAELLPLEEARRTYDEIVARLKDPALLEFVGYDLIRSSVFPVPAHGGQRVRVTYEHLLEAEGDRVDYALPRSESLAGAVPWEIRVELEAKSPISTVYSPSHALATRRVSERRVAATLEGGRSIEPGPFLLSYLRAREGVNATLYTYPDPEVGGGFFLFMAGLPVGIEEAERELRREVTIVLDRSGSMAGGKLDQAKAAALQVIEGLADGEAFNLLDYSSQVALFNERPVLKSAETVQEARAYLARMRPGGGTNIHDALLEALRQGRHEGMLPIVLFLTDGLPTVGRTSELDIRDMVERGNPHGRRVFTFGVGSDVNVPLLDRLSDQTRASATYVLPQEDVEVKVAKVFRRLYGPVLADLALTTLDPQSGETTTRAVRELMPARLPDLFDGDQLVVLGQYTEERPLEFRLEGNFLGEQRAFRFAFDPRPSTRNAFVPRLWAARKIAFLVDHIRQAGALVASGPATVGANLLHDPRYKELAEEILRLSTRYGVLSEYTAFLATEGTDLGDWNELQAACDLNLNARAVWTRSGEAAVNQGRNFNDQKVAAQLNYANTFWNAQNELVACTGVQQMCDRAFFQRGAQWIDAALIGVGGTLAPDQVVLFGSEEHKQMVTELANEGRQGLLSLPGEILLQYQGRNVLVRNGAAQGGEGR